MALHKLSWLLLVIFLINGCATLDKDECRSADWKAIGYEDGSDGYVLATRFKQHRQACSKHGIKANFNRYRSGHDQGIRSYCTASQGYKLGKYNRGFPSHCPTDLSGNVRRGYDFGHDIYLEKREFQQQVKSLQSDLEAIDENIVRLRQEKDEHLKYLAIAEKGLANPDASDLERVVFYNQRDNMKKMIRQNNREIERIEAEREHYQYSIKKIEQNIETLDNQPMPKLAD